MQKPALPKYAHPYLCGSAQTLCMQCHAYAEKQVPMHVRIDADLYLFGTVKSHCVQSHTHAVLYGATVCRATHMLLSDDPHVQDLHSSIHTPDFTFL